MSTTTGKAVMPRKPTTKPLTATPVAVKGVETAADRRNYLRRLAGWPVKGNKDA